MNRRIIAASLFYVVALSAQTLQPTSKPPPRVIATGSIEGIALDSMTGLPVAGARITLRNVDGQNAPGQGPKPKHASTTTDGRFLFEDVLTGKYRVFAERPGYVAAEYGARAPGSPGSL